MEWTKKAVIQRMAEVNKKGFISISDGMYRNDDGIVGQVLEREFNVDENNLHIADLGTYELKGMRVKKGKSNKLTLFTRLQQLVCHRYKSSNDFVMKSLQIVMAV
jgi:hypothetical protein